MRSGNPAGLGAGQAASAEGGARAAGGALNSILAKNAEMKATQQQQGNAGLANVMGQDIHGQVSNAGLVREDIHAGTAADQTGWLQNTEGALGSLENLGKSAKSFF